MAGNTVPGIKQRAFSITELMVVLTLISILSTLGILSYANMHQNNQTRAAGQRVASTLSTARQYAIAGNTPYQVYFNVSDATFWIDELDSALAVKRRQVEPPGMLPEFTRFQSISVNNVVSQDNSAIRFWPDGHADTATIELWRTRDEASDARNRAQIRVFGPTGTTQVSVGGVSQ